MSDDDNDIEITTTPINMLGEVWTQGALDGLVGQTPMLTVGFEWNDALGRATVAKAEQRPEGLILTLTIPSRVQRQIEERFGEPEPAEYSIGFTRHQPPGPIRLLEIATGVAGQLWPKPALPKDC